MRIKRSIRISFLVLISTVVLAAQKTGLPFIHDDYSKALSTARQKKLPIFVECWAPW